MSRCFVVRGRLRPRWSGRAALLSVLVGALAGCNLDALLDAELPSQVERSDAEVPARAAQLVEGGIALFNCALATHLLNGGLLGDELRDTGLSPTDARRVGTGEASPGGRCSTHYQSLSQARWVNDHVYELLDGWSDADVPDRSGLMMKAAAYAGYTLILMGEAFCSMAIDGGPELQPDAVFALAEERFTRVLDESAAGAGATVHLARVGRARARLNLGRHADARADALLVPADFVATARFPATTQSNRNPLYTQQWEVNRYPVDWLYRDVRFAGVPDPRVNVVNRDIVNAQGDTIWAAVKYNQPGASVQLATWEEAQLIIAEAELKAGNLPAAVSAINALHAKVSLPPFESSDPEAIMEQIIAERRAELFLEGHHLGDYRRYELPFVPPPGSPYPRRPEVYGDARCFPLPQSERDNNPNL